MEKTGSSRRRFAADEKMAILRRRVTRQGIHSYIGMTHVRTSPYYPQPNDEAERVQKPVKTETIRKRAPRNLAEAIRSVGGYVEHYHNYRLHSAIGYVAPADKLNGKQEQILRERQRKLEQARARREDAAATRRVP